MNAKENKYHYDLKNVHYAQGELQDDGTLVYGVPKRIKGAISMDISAEGDTVKTRADGIDYIVVSSNNGYSGTINFVNVSDEFKRDVLGEKIDAVNGIQYEDANIEPIPFALLFEFVGDEKNKRHILYNNIASRIKIVGENKENQKEPDTEELEITSSPTLFNINGEYRPIVKASTVFETKPDVYKNWYQHVHIPEIDAETDVTLKSLAIDSLDLIPTFDQNVYEYTATANTASNKITAIANAENATIEVKVNSDIIASGSSASWIDGTNELIIKVMNGNNSRIYKVIVTKETSL